MKNIISITEARSKIFEIAEKVQKTGQVFAFTENGKPKVVIMSSDDYENIMEDLELMKNHKFMAKINKVEQEFSEGKYTAWKSIREDLLGSSKISASIKTKTKSNNSLLLLADAPSRKYLQGAKKAQENRSKSKLK